MTGGGRPGYDDTAMNGPHEANPPRSSPIPLVCSPPRLPADSRSKRLVDALLPTGVAQWVFFASVAAAVSAAPYLQLRPGLALDLVATAAAAAWCLINFWRCREAHCVVTGFGWTGLAALELLELALGRSFISGDEGIAFVAILVAALVFEAVWRMRHGTNAIAIRGR